MPSILHTSPHFILTATQEGACQQHATPACSLNSTGSLRAFGALDTNSPKWRPCATATFRPHCTVPTSARAAGAMGSWSPHLQQLLHFPRECLLGPYPTTKAEKDVTSCCCLLSRNISRNLSHQFMRLDSSSSCPPALTLVSVSEDVCLSILPNFYLQKAFQTINPSPIVAISIIKYRYLLIVNSAFCATLLLRKTYVSTCFHKRKKIRRGFTLLWKKAKSENKK